MSESAATTPDDWEVCPTCNGDEGYVGVNEDGTETWVPCSTCQGQGGWSK